MPITKEEIKHIAELSRLKLSDEEMLKLGADLSSILDYIEKLKEVDTRKVTETAQVSGLSDVWREDEIKNWDREEVIASLNQGELENDQLKVKRIL
ncbi:MAG: Asp-tRNA(Asn)/Glu-tRNA(Gln) amidotransferase subunit GatC [Patescibacteria group bacterium]